MPLIYKKKYDRRRWIKHDRQLPTGSHRKESSHRNPTYHAYEEVALTTSTSVRYFISHTQECLIQNLNYIDAK